MSTILPFSTRPTSTSAETAPATQAKVLMRVTDQRDKWRDEIALSPDDTSRATGSSKVFWPAVNVALITTFAPEPYEVRKPIAILLQPTSDGFVASFSDANLHATGDDEQKAYEDLKSLILDMFDMLAAEDPNRLGSQPARQLDVLKDFIAPEGIAQ